MDNQLTDSAVLDTLRTILDPQELSQSMTYLLRVPEAWHALHKAEFLDRVIASKLSKPITPSRLTWLFFDGSGPEISESGLPEFLESRLLDSLHAILQGKEIDNNFETIALIAVGIARQSRTENNVKEITSAAVQRPQQWKSALCCAWTLIQEPGELLASLIDDLAPEGISLTANMLLANMSAHDAAAEIMKAAPHTWNQLAFQLRHLGMFELTQEMARMALENNTKSTGGKSSPKTLLADAFCELSLGAHDQARESLNRAWKETENTAASIADHIAESAVLEGDGILEIEARKQALRSKSSPRRRADLILALANNNKLEDALSVIDMNQEPASIEEQISYGMTFSHTDEKDRALSHFITAAEYIPSTFGMDHCWANALLSGLQDCGAVEKALQIAKVNVDQVPSNYAARSEYIRMLSSFGDHTAAAAQANLLLAMQPQSREAREMLAANLTESGSAKAGIEHWKALADEDPNFRWDLAECALQANEAAIAEETVMSILQNDPESPRAKVFLGRAQAAQGHFDAARESIREALKAEPDLTQGWISLAETEVAAGDLDAAGNVLAKAIERSPNQASLYAVQSTYQKQKGLLEESAQSLQKAIELDASNVEWLLQYGETLDTLGRDDIALSTLIDAHSLEPFNWRVRTALGTMYEKHQEYRLAAELLSHLPDEAPAEAHYLAGRVIVKSDGHQNDQLRSKAVDHLQIARDSGVTDPVLDYWMGRAQEIIGENEPAFQNYQSSLKSLQETDQETYKQALMGTSRTALATDRLPIALTTLETAQEKFPASTDILYQLSQAYLSAGMPEQALHVAQKTVELEPGNQDALHMLRDSAVAMKRWDQAIHAAKRMLEYSPESQSDWMDLAQYLQKANRQDEARNALAHAIAIDRRHPKTLLSAAQVLIHLDKPAYAQINLKHALSNAPEDADTYEALAKTSQMLGDFECEQEAWKRLLELEPNNLTALSQGAQSLWNLDRRASAIGLWQRAVEIDGENTDLNFKLGHAYLASGETQRGLDHIVHAYKMSPTSADLAKETGNLLLRYGSPLDALEVLQRAGQLLPNDIDCIMDLGNCYLRLGRYDEAEHTLTQVKARSPYPIRADALLAQIALTKGDLPLAEQLLETARHTMPRTLEDTLCIADTSTRMGRWSEALKTLQDSLSMNENVETLLALTQLRLRLADAHWLYATMGAAHAHAPSSDCATSETPSEVIALIDRLYQAGAPKNTIDQLKRWSSFTFGSISEEEYTGLAAQSTDDWSQIAHAHAIFLFKTGNAERAIEIVEADPDNIEPDSWGAILLGLCHTSLGDTTQAVQAYNIASRNMVVQPLVSFFASETLWQAGEVEDALSSLNLALSAWPEEVTWHSIAASRYEEVHRFDAAVAHLQQAVELEPHNPVILHALAHALRSSGQLSESLAYYEQVLENAPEHKTAWKEAAEVAMANGKAKTAQAWFEQASSHFPSDPTCLIGAARAAMSQGKSEQAISHIEKAAHMAPENLEVLLGLGEILASQGKYEKAIRAYDQAIKSSNGQLDIRIGRCKLLIQIGRSELAIPELQALLEENSHDERLYAVLSEAYESSGDLENAIEAATQATLLSPRNADYRYQVGRLCRLAGQLDRSLDELLQAQSTTPTMAKISRELGQVYEQRREIAQALDAYRRALELDPQDELSHFRAGLILKQQKAYPQAARLLERAIELNPKDSEIIQQLAAVRALELVHGGL
jgi:tetratricopeptide (TPR) repeat protein